MPIAQPPPPPLQCDFDSAHCGRPYLEQLRQLAALRDVLPREALLAKRDDVLSSLLRNLSPTSAAEVFVMLRDQPEKVIGTDWCVFGSEQESEAWLLKTVDEAGGRACMVTNSSLCPGDGDRLVSVLQEDCVSPESARDSEKRQCLQKSEKCTASLATTYFKVSLSNPEEASSGAIRDVLSSLGIFFGAGTLSCLSVCSRSWHRTISSSLFREAWHSLIGRDCPLLTHETEPRRKYLQMANLSFGGTWLDRGTDRNAQERYRFLTAVRETRCRGSPLQRSFAAVSKLDHSEVKHSHGRIEGAVYVCYETFENSRNPLLSDLVNISSGILDMRDAQSPRITGTWMMIRSDDPSIAVTTGSFEFVKVDDVYDERAGLNQALRRKAGLPQSRKLYVTEPW